MVFRQDNDDEPTSEQTDEATALVNRLSDEFGDVAIGNPEEASARMSRRVFAADSMDELFDALEGQSSDELIGKAFTFNGVEWDIYQSQRGPIPLAVCDVVDLGTGEVTEFVTTARMLTSFLRRAETLGGYPFNARIAGKKTNRGQTALNFERA